MATPKRRQRYSKPEKPKVHIDPSPETFERAFCQRLGQTPLEWVKAKVEGGSQLRSIQYLFEISAAAIAEKNNCMAQDFERYYAQYMRTQETKPMSTKKTYNRLVRDRIPEIIKSSGKQCTFDTLSDAAYITMLDVKLDEAVAEYQRGKSLEELADLLEVMGVVVKARGYTWDDLTAVRKKKRAEYGGFENRICLKNVWGG